MKIKLFKMYLLPVVMFLSTQIQAQQVVAAAGGNASGSGGSVSYTVGQVCYTSVSGSNGKIIQGVQQPFEISVISAIETDKLIDLQCKVYPNPVTHSLCLILEETQLSDCFYQLFDNSGKLIKHQKITGSTTDIDMSALPPAAYFLKVNTNIQELKTFKIIKN